jgi:DUF971 family protein
MTQYQTNPTTEPEHIAVSKSKGIDIDWKDGHHSSFPVAYLRDECPCATCTGVHGTVPQKSDYSAPAAPFQMFKPAIKMLNIEPAGNYGLKIFWNDGHSGGIYSYEYLRSLCPCADCKK